MSRAAQLASLLALSFLAAAGTTPGRDEPENATIHLRNGGLVRGEILRRKANSVIVDLGFTVVSIPTDQIDRMEAGAVPSFSAVRGDLFSVDPSREELTVRENIDRCGEAVLQVRTPTSLGSGFVIHPDGYVVTNHHVISGERDITLTLFERGERELRRVKFDEVRIVAFNPHLDLALLKVEGLDDRELPVIPIGDSDRLQQGQTVFAIGSPLGMDRTVSEGIVSLKNRPLAGHLYVQSTVQVNPGNSGGPLLNLHGELVGVNNMKISAISVEGMSFAVPANNLKWFLANRDAFAFDPRNPNAGFRYHRPPDADSGPDKGDSP